MRFPTRTLCVSGQSSTATSCRTPTPNTSFFDVPKLIEYISRDMTLEPGDIIATGTPPGVGAFRDPPRFLKPGDVLETEVEGLGILRNPVLASTQT